MNLSCAFPLGESKISYRLDFRYFSSHFLSAWPSYPLRAWAVTAAEWINLWIAHEIQSFPWLKSLWLHFTDNVEILTHHAECTRYLADFPSVELHPLMINSTCLRLQIFSDHLVHQFVHSSYSGLMQMGWWNQWEIRVCSLIDSLTFGMLVFLSVILLNFSPCVKAICFNC